jgi:hypothetical protein
MLGHSIVSQHFMEPEGSRSGLSSSVQLHRVSYFLNLDRQHFFALSDRVIA